MRKTRDVIVNDSQLARPIAINDLQSTTESQQRQNAREIVNEEYTNIKWGERNLREVSKKIKDAYDRIVFWKKNLFMLPTDAAAKKYITETTKLMNGWTNNSPLKDIAFKAIHIMPNLLLQKPSKTSKAKDHLKALGERTDLWSNGNIDELLFEGETIQSSFHHINTPKKIGELSKKFTLLMEKGKRNEEVLLRGEKASVHPAVFEDIDEKMVKEAALKTKGGSGPSGLDAHGRRRILVSKSSGMINADLRSAFANVIKKICTEKLPVDTT